MSDKQLPFFVYGTLRVGQPNFRLVKGAVKEYALDVPLVNHVLVTSPRAAFPFMIKHAQVPDNLRCLLAEDTPVIGDLLWIKPKEYDRVSSGLDALEGVPDLYERHVVQVNEYEAWAYVAGSYVTQEIVRSPFSPTNNWNDHEQPKL